MAEFRPLFRGQNHVEKKEKKKKEKRKKKERKKKKRKKKERKKKKEKRKKREKHHIPAVALPLASFLVPFVAAGGAAHAAQPNAALA